MTRWQMRPRYFTGPGTYFLVRTGNGGGGREVAQCDSAGQFALPATPSFPLDEFAEQIEGEPR